MDFLLFFSFFNLALIFCYLQLFLLWPLHCPYELPKSALVPQFHDENQVILFSALNLPPLFVTTHGKNFIPTLHIRTYCVTGQKFLVMFCLCCQCSDAAICFKHVLPQKRKKKKKCCFQKQTVLPGNRHLYSQTANNS